ncbi:hypothetical protein BKA64DRAFT_707072 [Cadophora sp. MPI-SDFR-AT-0126]|nr:hypothetical protein BKA64DRAFT_707072 [Leotiomycetes sp. MPI-SDFR-AT-0126]
MLIGRQLQMTDDDNPDPYDNVPNDIDINHLLDGSTKRTWVHDILERLSCLSNARLTNTLFVSGGGGASRKFKASTNSLPDGGSISNVNYKEEGDIMVYTADILVLYAFVCLFIGGPHETVGTSAAWLIGAGTSMKTTTGTYDEYKLVNYLVEGNDFYSALYKYTGAYVEGSQTSADWTWTQLDVAPQTQSGYTNTWRVPIGSTDALPDQYVV